MTGRHAIDGGPQGVLRKRLFPQPRRELLHLLRRVPVDPLQDVHQVGIGIDPLQAAGG